MAKSGSDPAVSDDNYQDRRFRETDNRSAGFNTTGRLIVPEDLPLPDQQLPVIDDTRLSQEFRDSPEVLAELRDLFLQHVCELIAELGDVIAAGDAPRLAQVAHTFKGACATYGAPRLAFVCAQMEQLGKAADLARATAYLAVLEDEGARATAVVAGITVP
jgi:HPt (histidine-containing phosphotransfer) domain-containing protein